MVSSFELGRSQFAVPVPRHFQYLILQVQQTIEGVRYLLLEVIAVQCFYNVLQLLHEQN